MAAVFFNGTLMHPSILKRVIGHDGSYLQIRPALLLGYTRHKTNGGDYPGMVPYSQSRVMFSRDLEPEERSVRGSMVVGLSDKDMRLLDIFEGDEYTRELVHVHPLGPSISIDNVEVTGEVPPIPPPNELETTIEVFTYVWCRPLSELQPKLWSFKEFIEESAWKWIGAASRDREDYTEVDRRRDMEGTITVRAEA
ncbi:hypothetical protein EV363DRAFT_1447730 [Boletus edulis]|nr:hypothetical protein EV363DRAFT_1447730 [Boletus edulis]